MSTPARFPALLSTALPRSRCPVVRGSSPFLGRPTSAALGIRHYAKASKSGAGPKEDNTTPLGPFYPKPAEGPLPNVVGLHPNDIELPFHPRHRQYGHTLLRAIDVDHRARHDFDNRAELFRKGSPLAVQPGSVILIEQIASRSRPRKSIFAGVLIAIRRKGILTNIVVRNYVLRTGVEMVFPVFSPMISRIKVLKRVKGLTAGDDVFWLRKDPEASPLKFEDIDQLVAREAEAERRQKAAQ
ncbi:hypothetical protein HK104_002680 [Borealophlyctis nickersoniae]|nr:hypothetical protein HK104_002680 [Borealophlyctis nickersoniae]